MQKFYSRILVVFLCCAGLLFASASYADEQPVVVASTNFVEQLILAHIYTDVLEARGIDVKTRLNLGSREVVFPALKSGELDILPEYTGALLGYLTNGKSKANSQQAVLKALRAQLPKGIVALDPSPAQDRDGLVVTAETAKKYHLKTISDLKPVASKLVLGGPPELKTRYIGIPGLKKVYGLDFKEFRALDAGGPLTQGALANGDIDVARMFTTQGVIAAKGWVLLKDDKDLVPAQNLIAVVRKAVLTPKIKSALDAISAKLTTEGLRDMNKRVSIDKVDPETVASDWVKKNKLGK